MRKLFRRSRHLFAYMLVWVVIRITRFTPRILGYFLAARLSDCVYLFLEKERIRTLDHLRQVYPDKNNNEIYCLAKAVYHNLAYSFFDSIKLPFYPREKVLSYIGGFNTSLIEEALKENRGVIVLSGHLSAFELQTQFAQLLGCPCVTVGAELFDKRLDTLINSLRMRNNVEFIGRDGAMRGIIKALRAGKLFGVLIDQDTTKDGIYAPFLGKVAWTPATTIKMALKGNIPILYLSTYRGKDKQYYIDIQKPSVSLTGDLIEDALRIAFDFNRYYGDAILQHPEQWPWMHRRWKRGHERYPDHPRMDTLPEEAS